MQKLHSFLLLCCSVLFLLLLFHGGSAVTLKDGSESWGYVEVRPKAHMFWWYYKSPNRIEDPNKPWPIILWLQGGPGASGVGIGNFEEVGPLDTNLKPRNSTWLQKADLLFVDNPVGTGYSFVEDKNLFVKTDEEAAADLTTLLIKIFNRNETLQKSPLYIVAESYGGKYAVTLGLSALKAIESGKLKLKLGGIALGDSWISPEDFVGGSGVGIGNFLEVGPLDSSLKPRNSTWLQKADLLFVDNPVGTGYSFVEDKNLFVKTDEEAAADLTTLLIKIFNRNKSLQKSPLYIVAESYGGKYAVTLGLSALKAIESGKLKLKLGGIALGDSWISAEDFVFSWGPLLKDVARLDTNGLQESTRLAKKIKKQIRKGQFEEATLTWGSLENVILSNSNNVDFYNFLLDSGMDPVSITASEVSQVTTFRRYSRYLSSLRSSTPGGGDDFGDLMNVVLRKKLRIIPRNVTWGRQQDFVFNALSGDFMKPRIKEVDELLAKGVNVTVYNGQLDIICATKGAEAWVEKLKWGGLKTFLSKKRTPLYCGSDRATKAFTKSHQNLHFYWILGAGHFVPVDQPCAALDMVSAITQSPVSSKDSGGRNRFIIKK